MFSIKRRDKRPEGQLMMLAVSSIRPNPNQPRRSFDEYDLAGLAESIRCNGILQPLAVRKLSESIYELIAGERRLRAARMAGMQMVPCIIHKVDDKRSALLSLVENLQRRDLSMFEEAEGIARLVGHYRITQQEAAERLGMAQSTLANKLRLLKLTAAQRDRILSARLSERHARAIVRLPDAKERERALDLIIARQLTVSETDKLIDQMLEPPAQETADAPAPKRIPVIRDVRLFVNSITKVVSTMRQSGVDAKTSRSETDDYIEYTVIIPKKASGQKVG